VQSPEEPPADRRDASHSRRARAQARAEALRARSQRLADRAQTERRRHRSVDAAFEMIDRDAEVGGGIIAGALAYRLFIWLLPAALVAVAGLGIASDASAQSPEETAGSVGLGGLISSSITSAANSPNRWYALLVGIPILLWATRSVLRALIVAHRLVWGDVRATAPRPTPIATLRFFALLVGFLATSVLASAVRAWSGGVGLLSTVLVALPYAAIWLLVSVRLPHRAASWPALIPGAILVSLGVEVLHLVTAYVLVPYALAKQGTYGALGAAAALLFGLFLVCRLVVAGAVVNATLWERRFRAVSPS
jgi:uncharacterized BrkB/YihY/UPF0761 family membrane protein